MMSILLSQISSVKCFLFSSYRYNGFPLWSCPIPSHTPIVMNSCCNLPSVLSICKHLSIKSTWCSVFLISSVLCQTPSISFHLYPSSNCPESASSTLILLPKGGFVRIQSNFRIVCRFILNKKHFGARIVFARLVQGIFLYDFAFSISNNGHISLGNFDKINFFIYPVKGSLRHLSLFSAQGLL